MHDAPLAARFVLRARPAGRLAACVPLGLSLPVVACRSAVAGQRAALWLGPDEWLILTPVAEGEALATSLGAALAAEPHSLVDVSDRQIGLLLEGPRATDMLSSGCPLDLDVSAFPVGMCSRTVFAKSEIVLWRTAAEAWRVEVWRSFAGYVRGLLTDAATEYRTV